MNKELKKLIEDLFMLVRRGDYSGDDKEYALDKRYIRSSETIRRLEKQWTGLRKTKTEKQIVSGYHRPVYKKCHCELHPETNGVRLLDMADWGAYELYAADLWKCPSCGIEVVGGFAFDPISQHFDPDFQKMIEHYRTLNLLIENKG